MKVLSLDWDYFMNCSEQDRFMYFPDAGTEEIGSAMTQMCWAKRYAESEKQLLDIKTRSRELDQIKKWIDSQDYPYMLAVLDSHKHLGDFLLQESLEESVRELEIVNVDHHSDMFDSGDTLNCGNWLTHIKEKLPDTKITWIRNTDSRTDEVAKYDDIVVTDSIEKCSEAFDIIYLCRSSLWSCPHLDKEFSAFARFLTKRAIATILRQELPGRYDDDMKKDIKSFKEMLNKAKGGQNDNP